jgi:hypothetical protein
MAESKVHYEFLKFEYKLKTYGQDIRVILEWLSIIVMLIAIYSISLVVA